MAGRRQPRDPKGASRSGGSPHEGRPQEGAHKDLALIYGPSDDGEGYRVLRRRADSDVVEAGTLHPLREGRAITGEVVNLAPREEAPFLFDCETDHELSAPRVPVVAGPPQVATDEYRRGWDAIWGRRARPATVN